MKAITILQPWASLIACGEKKIETRSWATKYRGPIAIHAGKSWTTDRRELTYRDPFHSALWPKMTKEEIMLNGYGRTQLLPVGAVIAVADLVDCLKVIGNVSLKIGDQKQVVAVLENQMRVTGNEYEFGDFSVGRYAWILSGVRWCIDPVPAKGQQRIWNWNEKL
ncbi:hypothetical protein Ga0466249_002232 [Sporomusaceae bacterium BoRhaA]|uniref:ASCH domain-containing protein n=1 Tax=Pelorhabdus rhamnosifermentans TaxID=2772457 RepID=UPI001C05F62F|nr:ASCH domain-containing protein [Pelorhabdus rhamnosifermentans]MBU2701121.1 hypothetical protein [Pelorhabdus rhamnosifermentans]